MDSVKTFFSNLWAKVKNPLKVFFSQLLKTTFAKELEVVLPIAQRMVVAVENEFDGTGSEKRAAAFSLIVRELGEAQKEVGKNAIYTAIELVVAAIRSKIATAI